MTNAAGALGLLVLRVRRALDSRAAPWAAGLTTMLLVWWLWGSLHALPWVYDESAYLLQAKIFARGEWAAPGRPLPEFFEQMHVFVTPKLVPKYPPGHAILLVPGVWLGMPGLMPILLTGLTAALVFSMARSLTRDPWVGLVAWAVWVTSPVELYIRPSYLSQSTTVLLWLLGWWALLRWQTDRRLRWLIFFAFVCAWGAITRPITMAPFGLVAGLFVLKELWQRRELVRLVPMLTVAVPILLIAPLWSYRSTGHAFPTPYSEYSRVYAPWNMPGFLVDTMPSLRPPFPAMQKFRTEFLPQHEAHRPARLPGMLAERVKWIAITFWGEAGLRWLLLPLGLLGMVFLPRPARLALATSALLVLIYLSIAARARWTVYYLEAMPVLALATAVGALGAARRLSTLGGRGDGLTGGLVLAGLVVAVPGTVTRLVRAQQAQEDLRAVPTELEIKTQSIPGKAIVFIRPGPAHRPYESYVQNESDLDAARIWLVQDRGDDDRRLMALAPDRAAYVFDPGTGDLVRWKAEPR
jgi:hypothetical protein